VLPPPLAWQLFAGLDNGTTVKNRAYFVVLYQKKGRKEDGFQLQQWPQTAKMAHFLPTLHYRNAKNSAKKIQSSQ
jgi:hypothetical protein